MNWSISMMFTVSALKQFIFIEYLEAYNKIRHNLEISILLHVFEVIEHIIFNYEKH